MAPPEPSPAQPVLDANTRLAYERTYLAHERTQMGWVRTALALISFGFTIAKFFEVLREKNVVEAPRIQPKTIGVLMIASGLVALLLSDIQHRKAMQIIRQRCPGLPPSLAGITAALIALLGILALLGALWRI
jgi:putative membrane protein